jgi:hypothetical protein
MEMSFFFFRRSIRTFRSSFVVGVRVSNLILPQRQRGAFLGVPGRATTHTFDEARPEPPSAVAVGQTSPNKIELGRPGRRGVGRRERGREEERERKAKIQRSQEKRSQRDAGGGGGGVSPFECMCVQVRPTLMPCLVLCLPALHPSSSSRPSMLPCFPCPSSLSSPSSCPSLSGAAAGRPTTQLCTQLGPKAIPAAASPRGCTCRTAPERLDPTNPAATPCSAHDGRPTSGWCWGASTVAGRRGGRRPTAAPRRRIGRIRCPRWRRCGFWRV